jgi:hypothetical protein
MKNYQKTYKNHKHQKLTNSESQQVFFECVKLPHLSEFLHRVTASTFDNDILTAINNDSTYNPPNNLQIRSEIGSTTSNNPSIYTKVYYDNIEQAHLTIHLCPTKYNTKTNGPFHIVNVVKTRNDKEKDKVSQRIYIDKKSDGSIHFLLGSPKHSKKELRPEIKNIVNYILHILNAYFGVKGPMRLSEAQHNLTNHPLLSSITKIRQNILSKSQQKPRRQSRH